MATSFSNFMALPIELRLKIWRLAVPRRTVNIKFKLDLQDWTDMDTMSPDGDYNPWWYNNRLVSDGPPPALPSIAYVNREAREEVLRSYRGRCFHVDKERVRWLLPGLSGSYGGIAEHALGDMCNGTRLGIFHPDTDVLEWAGELDHASLPSTALGDLSALIAASCLSVRHASLSYTTPKLELLAMAVADPSHPLQTLTVDVCQLFQFRLALRPPNAKCVPERSGNIGVNGREDLLRALSRDQALFLPGFLRTSSVEQAKNGDQYPATFLKPLPPSKSLQELVALVDRRSLPTIEESYVVLDSRLAIFLVVRPQQLLAQQLELEAELEPDELPSWVRRKRPSLSTSARTYEPYLPAVPAGLRVFGLNVGGPWEFNAGGHPVTDVLLWLAELRAMDRLRIRPLALPADVVRGALFHHVPFHGVCTAGFGLPDGGGGDSRAEGSKEGGGGGTLSGMTTAWDSLDDWSSRCWRPDAFPVS